MKIETILSDLGFSKNESAVYLAALASGSASAQIIAKKAKLQRTTAYSVLDQLVHRGIVAKSHHKGKTHFAAAAPEKLLSVVKTIELQLQKALPELEAMYNTAESVKPKILFYEGHEAIQAVYDDTLKEKPAEILEWNTNAYFTRFPGDTYIAKRMDLNIKARRLAGAGSVWQTKHQKYDRSELTETVIVPRENFWPDVEVNIYGDKVAFMNYADEMSVIIQNKAIAEAMKQAYELSWRGAKAVEIKPETR